MALFKGHRIASHRCAWRPDRLEVQPHRIMHKHAQLCKWLKTKNHRIWACFLFQNKQTDSLAQVASATHNQCLGRRCGFDRLARVASQVLCRTCIKSDVVAREARMEEGKKEGVEEAVGTVLSLLQVRAQAVKSQISLSLARDEISQLSFICS